MEVQLIIQKLLKFSYFQIKMRKSCHEENRKLLQAYQFFQRGQYDQSLGIYQSILQRTTHPQLRYNLICTISVISTAMGNYNYALQILEQNINGMKNVPILVRIRCYANLCFVQIIMGMYEEAINTFSEIQQIIIGADNHQQALTFVFKLFFRVNSLQEISREITITKENTLLQAFYMLNLAFAKDICGFDGSQTLLKSAYPIFIMHKKMQLAVVCLRQLLLLPLSNKDILKYEKQIGKIMSMELMQEYQLDNAQPLQCCKRIAQELIVFSRQLSIQNKQQTQPIKYDSTLWKFVLHYQNRKLMSNVSICEDEKQTIFKNIQMMLKQTNPIIISEMKKFDFYLNAERQIEDILISYTKIYQSKVKNQLSYALKKINSYAINEESKRIRNKSSTPINSKKEEKQNRAPVLLRDRSAKSIASQCRKSAKKQLSKSYVGEKQYPKIVYKMIKFCEYGSFLSKRNFNSDGGQYRFVRVTQSVLKWAKNPQKIEESCQIYPLKDINSIHYGKCTPTLLKQSNQLLKQDLCFSLRLQKRTLDFYCKDFEQVTNWVCGFTYKLKQINPKFQGYTIGKMLWKRMFMLLRQNFTDKIRKHERKFYYQTAHAVILFGKNNYQLPNKSNK